MAKSASSARKSPASTQTAGAPVQPAAAQRSIATEVKPSADHIRRRAYEIYTQRLAKGETGTAETDWLQAERDLLTRR